MMTALRGGLFISTQSSFAVISASVRPKNPTSILPHEYAGEEVRSKPEKWALPVFSMCRQDPSHRRDNRTRLFFSQMDPPRVNPPFNQQQRNRQRGKPPP